MGGGGDVGAAAEWSGVGVLLYQALTGSLPFSGAPHHTALMRDPRLVVTYRPGLETDLSLRTRLLDAVAAGCPILTTEGGGLAATLEAQCRPFRCGVTHTAGGALRLRFGPDAPPPLRLFGDRSGPLATRGRMP